MIFRRFYAHSNSQSLSSCSYISFVRPYLEYAAPVSDPHCMAHIRTLERVKKFSLRMSFKSWNEEYHNLLLLAGLQPLSDRRRFQKLGYLIQILNGTIDFPNAPIERRHLEPRLRNSDSQQLYQPFARTKAYQFSFFPHTISYGTTYQLLFINTHLCLYLSVMLCLTCKVFVFFIYCLFYNLGTSLY